MPPLKHLHAEMHTFAKNMSERLLPRTSAYHEIWLDKKMVAGDAVKDFEPIYGESYLPRKVCGYCLILTSRTDEAHSSRWP
jgi:sulfite reductase (NADPH) hemoprotein beta-component